MFLHQLPLACWYFCISKCTFSDILQSKVKITSLNHPRKEKLSLSLFSCSNHRLTSILLPRFCYKDICSKYLLHTNLHTLSAMYIWDRFVRQISQIRKKAAKIFCLHTWDQFVQQIVMIRKKVGSSNQCASADRGLPTIK